MFSLLCVFLSSHLSSAAPAALPILAPLSLLKEANLLVLEESREAQLGVSLATPEQLDLIGHLQHEKNRCGGYEVLSEEDFGRADLLTAMKVSLFKERASFSVKMMREKNPAIASAIEELSADQLKSEIVWLSEFHDRDNRKADANVHVRAFVERIKERMATYPGVWKVETIKHNRTHQDSIRLHLEGKKKPSEVVVLGAHLDSINWQDSTEPAPGADDNASGSANLFEALRILVQKPVAERSIDFFWYAGEESGLLGSSEIAGSYKKDTIDVVAVLQLDMTLVPGSGPLVLGSISDFTSSWLREYFAAINDTYLQLKVVSDECGYACSDHASWFRQGYPAIFPFESAPNDSNSKIHTAEDSIANQADFVHALAFSKIALIFAMDMANSSLREPK